MRMRHSEAGRPVTFLSQKQPAGPFPALRLVVAISEKGTLASAMSIVAVVLCQRHLQIRSPFLQLHRLPFGELGIFVIWRKRAVFGQWLPLQARFINNMSAFILVFYHWCLRICGRNLFARECSISSNRRVPANSFARCSSMVQRVRFRIYPGSLEQAYNPWVLLEGASVLAAWQYLTTCVVTAANGLKAIHGS